MKYYTIINGTIATADNKEALTRFYDEVNELPSDYEDGKYIPANGNNLVLNPNYAAEQAEKERAARIEEIKEALNELDKKRIRAMCEPSEYAKGVSWLEYYNNQARELRAELQEPEGAAIDSNIKK